MGSNRVMGQQEVTTWHDQGSHEAPALCPKSGNLMDFSCRHMFRLLKRYREEGDQRLILRLRWKASNRGYPKRLNTGGPELYWRPEYGA